jgi:serine phosphatase RsbU (regulator of sigma subunit)/anti-sigma regulatory factor (Ser/Thr protein kinase)
VIDSSATPTRLGANLQAWLGAVVALMATGAVTALSLAGLSATATAMAFCLASVAVTTSLGGLAAGLLATTSGLIAFRLVYVLPRDSLSVTRGNAGVLVAYLAGALLVSYLLSRARSSHRRLYASHAQQELERTHAEELGTRLSRLQGVLVALSEAVTPSEVAEAIVREGLVALRAQAASVVLIEGKKLTVLASSGFPVTAGNELSVDSRGPIEEAVRTHQLVVAGPNGAHNGRWRSVPSGSRSDASVNVVAPLVADAEPVGVLHLAFRRGAELDVSSTEFIITLARQCAQALERARIYEAEARARERAETLARRLRRLQLIVDAFLEGGSFEDLLNRLLERVRDAIGSDTATILVVDESGENLRECASIGFPGSIATSIRFGEGFAGRIAVTQTPNVVPDISKIEVVSGYLRNSGIVSLAGVPLLSDRRTIGVLHVGTRRPHGFEREELLVLRLAASRVAAVLERARAREHEHRVTETLQRSLLPGTLPSVLGIETAARYVPAASGLTVSGDWYDAFELADGSVGIVVGDVVGHGVPAAATMGRLRDVLRAYGADGLPPAEALTRLNAVACRQEEVDAFATVVYAVVDRTRDRIRMSSAGHLPPLLRHPDGRVERLEQTRSLPIGASRKAVYRESEVELETGSCMVLYTDGLVERRGESIDTGIDRLAYQLAGDRCEVTELADRVVGALTDDGHGDDVVLVALEFETLASPRLALELPAEPRSLAAIRADLRGWLRSVGADEHEAFDIVVAVNEACSNAIEHPQAATAHERVIKLDAQLVDRDVSVVIRDPGGWKPRGERGDRGRGLEFMEALMEGMELTLLSDETAVRLRRRLGSKVVA